ncbi:acyl-CoA dehydrogenase family protein [Sphingobacterium sp. HJSM2_6]|uniref:acyl-CoA dehydrogenase family protein n=1 Tax=Sphingobacterium sp. HJSM2_6 TaxID=3366264 RepID=UPI003BBE175C
MIYSQMSAEHFMFRDSLRTFIQQEIVPHIDEWELKGEIDRMIWKKLGDMGFLGLNFSNEYGGLELDFYYAYIFCDEISQCFSGGFSISALVIQFMAAPYLEKYGSTWIKANYLKPVLRGEKICSIAITEPDAGSDIQRIGTSATFDGEYYTVNGSKTFITNGYLSDFIITAVKTNPVNGNKGISLLVIDRNAAGVTSRKISKMGWHASDTAEIHFDQVKVAKENLIGQVNQGFKYLMEGLQLERLVTSIYCLSSADCAVNYTLSYIRSRKAFGRYVKEFQAVRHRLSRLMADIEVLKSFVFHCCGLQNEHLYAVKECSIAKLKASELYIQVANECLQFFGGYGYTEEYKIARLYRDARSGTIIGGTSEIMLEILAKVYIDKLSYTRS